MNSGVELVWTPAHSGLEGNEAAHEAAQGLINRAASNDLDAPFEPLYTFHEITHHYRGSRGCSPPPHASLDRGMRVMCRQLQTNTFPTASRLSHIYPDQFSPQCTNVPTQSRSPVLLPQGRLCTYFMVLPCQSSSRGSQSKSRIGPGGDLTAQLSPPDGFRVHRMIPA